MADPKMVLRPEHCVVLDGKPCAACTEDMELEKEIKQLEIRIEEIHSMRRALRMTMNENHDPLIYKFPPEIASHFLMKYSPPSMFFERSHKISPLYLGAVCQKWRQLAWATPGLWTSLKPGCPLVEKFNNNLPQLMTEWLERSASLPLTFRLVDHRGWLDGPQPINILNMHSVRWHDMHIEVPANLLDRFCGSSQGNILRRLVLCHPFAPGRNIRNLSTFSMKTKASPTDLTLRTVGLPYVNILWDNLTVASVYNIGVDDCLELIRRAPLLETLTLQAINPSSDIFPIPNTRIVHFHLRSLELLGIWKEGVVIGILDSLCLPSLEQWIHSRSRFPLDNMISFIGCLSSCLKTFKISTDNVDCHQLTGLLSHLSSLESLELRAIQYPLTGELISLLCASAQSPLYLPYLKSLESVGEYHFPWESLPQIFAPTSRWQSLRVRVYNVYPHLFEEETARLLLELVDKGFDLHIVGYGDIYLLQEHMRKVEGTLQD